MRYLVPDSKQDWYCFGPDCYLNWIDLNLDEKNMKDLYVAVRHILEEDICVTSSLIIDAYNIANNVHKFRYLKPPKRGRKSKAEEDRKAEKKTAEANGGGQN